MNGNGISLITQAKRWLESLQRLPSPTFTFSLHEWETLQDARWQALEDLFETTAAMEPEGRAQEIHGFWSDPAIFERIVHSIASGLKAGPCRKWNSRQLCETLASLIYGWILRSLWTNANFGVRKPDPYWVAISPLVEAEAQRLRIEVIGPLDVDDDIPIEWCRVIRLIDKTLSPTEIGSALLQLSGRDAMHFILELEVALSIGSNDSYCLSNFTLQWLLDTAHQNSGFDSRPSTLTLDHAKGLGLDLDRSHHGFCRDFGAAR